ncbi:hypothetical protein RJ639_004773 [Escallonia herrerae]|uniref:DUF6737 domain-containing protein n=1 Tax=Escallonia herrerae TaxID=1293975 RepID=A0AA89B0V8_9ASTE|nr:hypothetical protein RJ639_004773 [Escallonia herrerae]
MIALAPPISCLLRPTHHAFAETQASKPKVFSVAPQTPGFGHRSVVVRGSNSIDPKFLDEDGVVDDMDGYLNQLSLEYDSVWDTKPSWCQPWTITLTGVLVITSSWLILHSVVITALVLSLIGAWWYIFLYSYPKAYSDMIEDRRKQVTNGFEDTFGSRRNQ